MSPSNHENHITLLRFVLEKSSEEPVLRRIALLRGLAEICGDEGEAKTLRDMADLLERADKLCGEFKFSFVEHC